MDNKWNAKQTGEYSRESQEAKENATSIANILTIKGWKLTPICAVLGNMAGESGLNPWRWESDTIPTVSQFEGWDSDESRKHGYGLVQFTPANEYINEENKNKYSNNGYSPNFLNQTGKPSDGESQTVYMADTTKRDWLHGLYSYYADDFAEYGVDINDFFWLTFDEFISGESNGKALTMTQCVGAFELCYLRPAAEGAAKHFSNRVENADYWLSYLTGNPPNPDNPSGNNSKMPLWMYFKNKNRTKGVYKWF